MFGSLRLGWSTVLLLASLLTAPLSSAQSVAGGTAKQVTLADLTRGLPDYVDAGGEISQAFETATPAQKDAAVPGFIAWLNDERPRVRELALLSLGLLYMPSEMHPEPVCSRSLPVRYLRVVAARLRDADGKVRGVALLALQSVPNCGRGVEELVSLILPMLKAPEVLIESPDPFFAESETSMLARMTPQQQAQFKARPHKDITLPALGPSLLWLLARPLHEASPAVEEAVLEFLRRKDQTRATLGESVRILALSGASTRVNDEALRLVFEQRAMTVFLLQFVSRMQLTPEQLSLQRERLAALAKDEAAAPALRSAAKTVGLCWNGDRTAACRPTSDEFNQDANPR